MISIPKNQWQCFSHHQLCPFEFGKFRGAGLVYIYRLHHKQNGTSTGPKKQFFLSSFHWLVVWNMFYFPTYWE